MVKEKYLEQKKTSNAIAKILRESKITNWDKVSILEMLKIDIVLNSKMVKIDGSPCEKI